MLPDSIESDRREFFRHVFDDSIGLEQLLRFYISYHGLIFQDQRNHFASRVSRLLGCATEIPHSELFGRHDELAEDFLNSHCPTFNDLYFKAADHSSFKAVEILPESPNTLQDNSLPQPLNQRSGRASRAPFTAYVGNGGSLMCGPNQFQYFDRAARQFYPAASLRSYSADILMYEARSVDRPVVLIQDYGDGSNFAHFAFDWLPRIMHAIESGLIDPKACIFVMGGRKVPFQMLLLDALISHYKLDWSNFLFPESRLVLDIGDRFVFFSDQRLVPLHPAQMAHPRSISLIRDLCAQIRTPVGIDEGPKIFISREDAKLRRIANEAELSTAAHKAGYHVIRMGDHPIERQIAIVRNARYVVGPHGMGLTHLIFNRGPMGVFELFHPSLGTDAYSLMARALGFHYHWYVGKEILDHKGSYSVDAAEFESTLSNLQW